VGALVAASLRQEKVSGRCMHTTALRGSVRHNPITCCRYRQPCMLCTVTTNLAKQNSPKPNQTQHDTISWVWSGWQCWRERSLKWRPRGRRLRRSWLQTCRKVGWMGVWTGVWTGGIRVSHPKNKLRMNTHTILLLALHPYYTPTLVPATTYTTRTPPHQASTS